MFRLNTKKDAADKALGIESYQERVEQLSKRLSAFTTISQAMTGIIDRKEIFKLIAEKLVNVMDVSFASIWEWVPETETLRLKYVNAPQIAQIFASQILGKELGDAVFLNAENEEQQQNIILRCLLEDKILLTKDFAELGRSFMNTPAAQVMETFLRMRQAVHIPLSAGGEKLGVLGLIMNEKEADEEFLDLAQGFSSQVSTTIYNSNLFEKVTEQVDQLATQNKTLSALYNLTSSIGQSLDPSKVSQTAVDALPQDDFILGAIISLYEPERDMLVPVAATTNDVSKSALKIIGNLRKYGVKITDPNIQELSYMKTFKSGVAQFTDNVNDVLGSALPEVFVKQLAEILAVKSLSIFPLQGHDSVVGVIFFFVKSHTSSELTISQKQQLTTYSLQIGIALENAQLYQQSQNIQRDLQDTLAELKEARRKERDMLDVMGHELRTPISIVRNALSMLEMDLNKNPEHTIPVAKLSQYLKMASDSTRREINLIETMLSATKVDGARMQLSFNKVDVGEIMQTSVENHKTIAGKNHLEMIVHSPQEPVFAYADVNRTREIVDNLISNSLKYTSEGSITIQWWKGADFVWVMVKDTGNGIGEEDLPNLGKKFFRAHQYTKEPSSKTSKSNASSASHGIEIVRPGGTGLGLYVSFELIRMMHGEIYVNSIVGEGTTFTFSLPKFVSQPEKHYDQTFDAGSSQDRNHVHLNEAGPIPPAQSQVTSHGDTF